MFKDASNVEMKTDAGRVNLLGMLSALVLVAVVTVVGMLQWIVAALLQVLGDGPGPANLNPFDALLVYLGANVLCVAMLATLVITARRDDRSKGDT